MRSRLSQLVPALVATGLLAACAQERAPINHVQPNALPKSFFVGKDLQGHEDDPEFYTRTQVIDVGYGASQDGLFTSSWGTAEMTRIKFVIEENLLVARLAYERIADSDGKGLGKASTDGVIVAAFPIVGQFDIKRAYNPGTGEQMNILEENYSDRPWNEREYIRVDFSRNLNVDSYDFDTLSLIGVFGGVTYESLAYYVNDPNSEDAPHFDAQNGYFDITTKAFARPQMIDLSYLGWGIEKFPACFLDADVGGGGAPMASCNPAELTLRQGFKRVKDTDFEPQEWDGQRFKAYGGFYKDRYGYARNYGMQDDKWHRLLSHYNIWQRSHYYSDATNMTGPVECYTQATTPLGANPHRDLNKDGTEDECEKVTEALGGVGGSRCDTFNQKCTLPLRKRTEQPIVWYVTTGSNPEAYEGTDWATHDWDVAVRAAIAAGRNAECHATGGEQAACDAEFPIYKGQFQEQYEAIRLSWEVDACRNKKAYSEDCMGLADRLGAERKLASGVVAVAKMPEMVVLCHSPVEKGDHDLCGSPRLPDTLSAEKCYEARVNKDETTLAECAKALNVRIGDIRYHTVNNIAAPQDPSAWGIMLDSNDPITGETVSASINVWTYINDLWSQGVVDTSRLIKGELTVSDVTDGKYVKEWSTRASGGAGGGVLPNMTAKDLQELQTTFMTKDQAENFKKVGLHRPPKDIIAKAQQRARFERHDLRASATVAPTSRAIYEARRKAAVGTAVEAELARNPAWQQYAGVDPTKVDHETMMNLSSPLRGANPALLREVAQRRELALAQRGGCVLREAPAPLANAQLADQLEEKFGKFNPADDKSTQFARAERMRKWISAKAQHSVIVHEMGHSMGLRHNFVSSADAFSFRPQYWQLRTNDGKVTEKCLWKCPNGQSDCTLAGDKCVAGFCTETDGSGNLLDKRETLVNEEAAASCIGPRFFDPTTKTERDNLIWMFQQDSIMDYAGETTQDLIGLGVYDYAAARMFYGGAVAVFADADMKYDPANKAASAKARTMMGKMDNFGGIVGLQFDDYSSGSSEQIHYSQLNKTLGLLKDCSTIDNPQMYKPATWDDTRHGTWNPLLDGQFVAPDPTKPGVYTRCSERAVEYVPWTKLSHPAGIAKASNPNEEESSQNTWGDYYQGGPSIDPDGRVRVPYGFATDSWADLGNLSVYRHDNGADAYELFDFFITQQETGHIFANYRRHRQAFSVRNAANRALERYNEKMRDGAKGLALMANVYKDFAIEIGYPFEQLWPYIADRDFRPNILASAIAFDYFTRQMTRPSSGPHYINFDTGGTIALSAADSAGNPGYTVLTMPDGAFGAGPNGTNAPGAWGNVGFGGRLMENRLGSEWDYGEYRTDFTINCGSYYDKAWSTMLLTESVDNFISDSRRDFLDGRYRAVSMADLFPEGYRRWLANNLTNDSWIKAPRVAAKVVINGQLPRPIVEIPESPTGVSKFCTVDTDCGGGNKCCANSKIEVPFNTGVCVKGGTCPQTCGYVDYATADQKNSDKPCPSGTSCCQGLCSAGTCYIDSTKGLGWTSWLPAEGPKSCFWSDKGMEVPGTSGEQVCSADPIDLKDTLPVDPQVGWEMQKFLVAMTLQYLPENQMRQWIDMMAVWELGRDNDPGFGKNRIELHDPLGRTYVAKTVGTEIIFGKKVQRGPAARVLQYANELLVQAYYTQPGPDNDADGTPDWYEVDYDANGQPKVICDTGQDCTCEGSAACMTFQRYVSVPAFMRQVLMTYAEGDPSMKGIY
ncbi:MAG TPA: hypothetical protein VGK67_16925 [Myxococcales bacterium]|jgi:hypothetical protein